MHELSICRSLLKEAAGVAAAHGAGEVTGILVAIGPLSGVEPPLLKRAFEVARSGTIAAHGELDIEVTPVRVRCRDCGEESAVAVNVIACPRCGARRVEVTSGVELLLKQVTLAGLPLAAQA